MKRVRWIAIPDQLRPFYPIGMMARRSGISTAQAMLAVLRWLWWINDFGLRGAGQMDRGAVAHLLAEDGVGLEAANRLVREMESWGWIAFRQDGGAVPIISGRADASLMRRIRAATAKSVETHTHAEWQNLLGEANGVCPRCQRPATKMQKDHVVRLADGGSEGVDFIQPLCRKCNLSKGAESINWIEVRRAEKRMGEKA